MDAESLSYTRQWSCNVVVVPATGCVPSGSLAIPCHAHLPIGSVMCAPRYMMVYAPHPFITMCAGVVLFNEETPGMLPRTASFMADPSPFWHPPDPTKGRRRNLLAGTTTADAGAQAAQQAARTEGARLGDITGVAVGGDGSLWGLYR
jgi:hypothetical protein